MARKNKKKQEEIQENVGYNNGYMPQQQYIVLPPIIQPVYFQQFGQPQQMPVDNGDYYDEDEDY